MNIIDALNEIYYGVFTADGHCVHKNVGLDVICSINNGANPINLLTDSSLNLFRFVCKSGGGSVYVNMRHCGDVVTRKLIVNKHDNYYHVIGFDFYDTKKPVGTAQLLSVSRQARELAHVYSHYVRNHSARIQGLINMIDPSVLPPEERFIYDTIVSEANQLDLAIRKLIR